ncbi:nuclear transport factor 2 family protein [Maribacter sp. 2307ULW6-5]|uniref:nuclear transport factor 2 family protein n=1 Tax=Maribacter sp. 2307ULW6-5 TaxID=3386275 RepID=UPI0039BC9128
MKTIRQTIFSVTVLLLLPTLVGAQEPEVTLEFNNSKTAMQTMQQYVKALHDGDVNAMGAQLTNDVIVFGLGGGSVTDSLNLGQHREYFTNSTSSYDHTMGNMLYLPVKVTNNWNAGEWMLAWGVNTLRNKETGKEVAVPFHLAALVDQGKIARLNFYYDTMNIMTSQGYSIQEPTK